MVRGAELRLERDGEGQNPFLRVVQHDNTHGPAKGIVSNSSFHQQAGHHWVSPC